MTAQPDLPPPYSAQGFPVSSIMLVEDLGEAPPGYEVEDGLTLLGRDHIFADKTTRIAFIQKVLATKLLQLLGMSAVMTLFVFNRREVVFFMERKENLVYLIAMASSLFLVIFGLLVGCGRLRRTAPARYMFLVAHPFTLAVYLSVWMVYWQLLPAVALCFWYYCVVVFVLLLYSIFVSQTSRDFDTRCGVLAAVGLQAVIYSFTVPFLDVEPITVLGVAVPMLLEYAFLLYDLQAMTSSSYWHDIKPADFIDAAGNLNIDYFNILYNCTFPNMCNAFKRCSKIFKSVDEAVIFMR